MSQRSLFDTWNETPVTWGLIALHFALYGLMVSQAPVVTRETLRAFGGQFNPDIWSGETYRVVLAGLLHGSFLHVVMNNISLYVLGRLLERLLGSSAFATLYVLALLAGNVASLHFIPPMVVSVGASGAIMGLAGALFVLLLLDQRGRFLVTRPSGRYMFFAFVIFYLLFGKFVPIINNAAHVGGFVMGGLFGLYFWSRIPGENLPRWLGTGILIASVAGLTLMATRGIKPEGTYAWHFYHGLEAFHKGNTEDARRQLLLARHQKETPRVLNYLAQLSFQTQNYKEAATYFGQLQKQKPEHLGLWYYLIKSLHKSQQSAQAKQMFEKASKQLAKKETSRSLFEDATRKNQELQYYWAHLYAANHQDKQALLLYQKLLDQDPNNINLHNEIAWLLVTAENPTYRNPIMAEKHARFAVDRSPRPSATFLDTLATALFAAGQTQEAIKVMRQAIQAKDAKDVMPHLHFQLRRFEKSVPPQKRRAIAPLKAPAPRAASRPSTRKALAR